MIRKKYYFGLIIVALVVLAFKLQSFVSTPIAEQKAELVKEETEYNPLVEIASDHHAHYDRGGYHGSHSDHGEIPAEESRVLAIASSASEAMNPASTSFERIQRIRTRVLFAEDQTQVMPCVTPRRSVRLRLYVCS